MNPQLNAAYALVIKELIRQFFVVFGPNIVSSKLVKFPGIVLDKKGGVTVNGDIQKILKGLILEFSSLSPVTVRGLVGNILKSNPDLKNLMSEEEAGSLMNFLFKEEEELKKNKAPVKNEISVQTPSLQEVLDDPSALLSDKQPEKQSPPSGGALAGGLDESKAEEVEKIFTGTIEKKNK